MQLPAAAVIKPADAVPITPDAMSSAYREPRSAGQRQLLRGWSAAVDGQLDGFIRKRKTHQNMGNLFDKIYGYRPRDLHLSTWERCVTCASDELEDES